MLEATTTEVRDGNGTLTSVTISIRFNGKLVRNMDWTTDTPLTKDQVDQIIADKLSGIFS
jgi:hypothetical protein